MLALLRKILPIQVKNAIRPVKTNFTDPLLKTILFHWMQRKHNSLIKSKKGKARLRVVFLVIHRSVWKVDSVFQKMLNDPLFEPIILVCPYTNYDDSRMWDELNETYEYFNSKGYKTVSSYNQETGSWLDLTELEPDIVFFTNPHRLTMRQYYEDAYLKYLTCYVPYSFDVSRYENYQSQYNQYFHNAMWRIFAPHNEGLNIFKQHSQAKGNNVILTGYPFIESIKNAKDDNFVWKEQSKIKKKIIWAPHHTIDMPSLPYASFLKIACFMQQMAIKFSEDVQFAFKPHPILKSKLYNHSDWGKEKTDDFYSFWNASENTQYCDGEYTALFFHSDAMIHDSGSFLAEYLFVKKPVLYTSNLEPSYMREFYNDFGLIALDSHFIAAGFNQQNEIEIFIRKIIDAHLEINKKHRDFIDVNHMSSDASDRISSSLKYTF